MGRLATIRDGGAPRYDVFVSYAGADRDVVAPFVELLKRDQLTVWFYDRDMDGGPALKKQIADAIGHSAHTIVCLTDAYVRSQWTSYELRLCAHRDPAGESAGTILVRFKPMTLPVPPEVRHLLVSDLTDPRHYDRAFEQVTRLIKRPEPVRPEVLWELCKAPFDPAEPQVTLFRIRRANEALAKARARFRDNPEVIEALDQATRPPQ